MDNSIPNKNAARMKAIAIEQFGGTEQMKWMDLPKPIPAPDEVLVRVIAAGVNPVDHKICMGILKGLVPHEFPLILGWDVAGIVEQVGSQVKKFHVGEAVISCCRKPLIQHGSYAEYVVLPTSIVARKPQNLSFVEAASISLVSLTAYQALFDEANLQKGEIVLVHAAAGGVGIFATQLAKLRGAYVIGTASEHHHAFVRSLGADEMIDYHKVDFREAVRARHPEGVDVVVDSINTTSVASSGDVLKLGTGRLVSLLDFYAKDEMAARHLIGSFLFTTPEADELTQIVNWIEEGKLKTKIGLVFPLEEAAKAHEAIDLPHPVGKIVLQVAPE